MMKNWAALMPLRDTCLEIRANSFGMPAAWNCGSSKARQSARNDWIPFAVKCGIWHNF
jgi:hypothetical protein